MSGSAPLSNEVHSFIGTITQEEIEQVINALHVKQIAMTISAGSSMTDKAGVMTTKKAKKLQKKKAKAESAGGGMKRPLNAFMAYRNFYSQLLQSHPQAVVSKVMNVMWKEDLFKAKWYIIAAAYTVVRGNREKNEAPLGPFFAIVAPVMSIIPPNQYLAQLGWMMGPPRPDDLKKVPQLTRLFVPNLDSFPPNVTWCEITVDMLVGRLYEAGYVNAAPSNAAAGALTMMANTSGHVATEPVTPSPEEACARFLQEWLSRPENGGAVAYAQANMNEPINNELQFDPVAGSDLLFDMEIGDDFDAINLGEFVPPPDVVAAPYTGN